MFNAKKVLTKTTKKLEIVGTTKRKLHFREDSSFAWQSDTGFLKGTKIKKKQLKYILMILIMLILLCLGKNTRADTNRISITHGRGQNPADCLDDQGKDGINFFCMNKNKAWNWYSNSEDVSIIDPMEFYYFQGKGVKIEPSISFGLYTARELGYIELKTMQDLIWGSVKYSNMTCEAGDGGLYTYATNNTILERADQYGMFYYGVLGGGANELEMTVTGGDTAKVYVNQKDRKVIVGPYYINLKCHNVTSIDKGTIETNLWKELAGKNKEQYPQAPIFAECHIEVEGANNTKFLDKDGSEVQFPSFNEPFYIECNVENNVTSIHPKVNIKYIKSAEGESWYEYISDESGTKVPGYAVLDTWFDTNSATIIGYNVPTRDKFPHDTAIDFISERVTVRRCWIFRRC